MGYGLARLLLVALAALSLLAMGGLDDHHAGLSLAALPRDGMSEPAGPAGEGLSASMQVNSEEDSDGHRGASPSDDEGD
uniref:Uncharacterized protein n=1 Tax=Oryza sativa subsp. japonica TaxID=39947 RepID=Q6Z9G1_ORYSJ|nr:hypothetical protein [Oryza sativa Japonica Group]BAD09909.1 hypothetical protein [Oryza sativa Japonica Group]